ncbi:MAG: IclR family transcriptional regulator [Hyphomicrobiales bacterium]|nr:IclR family transcriptional regulator [Hyphomicrobiales bacterium]MCP5370718.1 IclR family transcriptional regulator [Hyphomicrobiales bacterium]
MASETKEFGSNLQTVSRAVALLRCFEQGAVSLTLAQLTRRLGLNKATVFRLATTLETEGLLDKDPDTGAYSVSYGLLALGRELLNPAGLATLAQPILKAAQEATRETAILNLRQGDRAVVVHEIVSPQAVRYALGVGYRADLRLGAASLAILAFLPGREADAVLAAPMPPLADGGTMTAEQIRARLPRVREEGYCTTDSQRERDAAGFAAPFFGADGTVAGSLSVVMPVSRAREEAHRRLCADTVRAAARELTARLGGDRAVG